MFKLKNIKFKGVFLIIFLFVCFFVVSFVKETYRNYKINKEIENLREDIELLHNKNLELSNLINYLKTDNFVEKEARLKFGMKKSGEKAFIVEKNALEVSNNDKNKEIIEEISNAQKWRDYFFGE